MASTYSSSLNLELQATGENSGAWGTKTNNNLQKLESAIKGYVSVAIASTTDSLTATDGTTADEQSNAIIKLTGSLTGNTTMQCEAVENWYIVDNATTMGTYTLDFKPAGGTATNLVSGSKHNLRWEVPSTNPAKGTFNLLIMYEKKRGQTKICPFFLGMNSKFHL